MEVKEILEDLNKKSEIKEKLERLQNLYDIALALEIDYKNNQVYKECFSNYATSLSSGNDARKELDELVNYMAKVVNTELKNINYERLLKVVNELLKNERNKENGNQNWTRKDFRRF